LSANPYSTGLPSHLVLEALGSRPITEPGFQLLTVLLCLCVMSVSPCCQQLFFVTLILLIRKLHGKSIKSNPNLLQLVLHLPTFMHQYVFVCSQICDYVLKTELKVPMVH
jgi:hypothetical protein